MSVLDEDNSLRLLLDMLGQKIFLKNVEFYYFQDIYISKYCPSKSNINQNPFLMAKYIVFTIEVFPKENA